MMRFIKKIPLTDKEVTALLLEKGWKKLKEPTSLFLSILLSMPFMFLNALVFIAFVSLIYPPISQILMGNQSPLFSVTLNVFSLLYLASIFVFMLAHELVHACFIPNAIQSEKTFWGINGFFAFVYTTEVITKTRFLVISIMPFLMLSIIFPLILSTLNLLNGWVLMLCLLNAMGSCVDCLNMLLVVNQVPKGASIVSSGIETYYF